MSEEEIRSDGEPKKVERIDRHSYRVFAEEIFEHANQNDQKPDYSQSQTLNFKQKFKAGLLIMSYFNGMNALRDNLNVNEVHMPSSVAIVNPVEKQYNGSNLLHNMIAPDGTKCIIDAYWLFLKCTEYDHLNPNIFFLMGMAQYLDFLSSELKSDPLVFGGELATWEEGYAQAFKTMYDIANTKMPGCFEIYERQKQLAARYELSPIDEFRNAIFRVLHLINLK